MVQSDTRGNFISYNPTPTELSPNGANHSSPASAVNMSTPQGSHAPSLFNLSGDEFPDFQRSGRSLLRPPTGRSTPSAYVSSGPSCQRNASTRPSNTSESSSSVFFGGPPAPMPLFQPSNVNMVHGQGQGVVPPPPTVPGMGAGQPGQQNAVPFNVMEFQAGGGGETNYHFYAGATAIHLHTPGTYVVGLTADITVGDRGSRGRAHHHPHRHHHPGHVDPATHSLDVTGHH
ncbi:uncharacterized protein LOC110858141 [Folsomia candida]|uniref:Uncharacterized protein n=1 Tax=Folsomia candida TaxID=158441 RepID=A0A226DFI9_FOLCA|nr:uncharacterized protein LOC110858141 [Folsomia candida]OXA43973.1 hypothetical protein Fcan01_21277 [Folsomia candida]